MAPTAAELRGQIAVQRILIYELAPKVGLHPTRLGMLLNERAPLSPDVALRIQQAIQEGGSHSA